MGDTLRSPTVTTKLQHLAEQAARDPQRVFTTLAHLIDEDVLREAYRRTSKSSAAGIDGVTAQQGYVANFAQDVVKGQGALSVEGIRQPESRTVQPQ